MSSYQPAQVAVELYETSVPFTQKMGELDITQATALGEVVVSTDVLVAESGQHCLFGDFGIRVVVCVINNPRNDGENKYPTRVYVEKRT